MEDELIEIMTAALLQENIITASTPAEETPIFRQGSLGEEDLYPDTFLTFWGSAEAEQSAYDNDTATVVWRYDVNAYSTSPAMAYHLAAVLRHLLKKAGWQTPDRGHDVGSDEITHTGRGVSVTYLKTYTPNAAPDPKPSEQNTNQINTQEEHSNG